MCLWNDTVPTEISQVIEIDRCIAAEVRWLNQRGVHTRSCCCGHGEQPPSALIYARSLDRARALGYEPRPTDTYHEITLRSGDAGVARIEDHRPHRATEMSCGCGHRWVAVHPEGTDPESLECPICSDKWQTESEESARPAREPWSWYVGVMEEKETLGDRIRRHRKARQLSLDKLANMAGIAGSYLWKLEKKGASPSIRILEDLAKALDVPPVALLDPAGAIPASLRQAQTMRDLPEPDVRDLARISFRGCQPVTAEDWIRLWLLLKVICRNS
jgi:transcriptional regulator with XRE-family HTH domain